MSPQYDPLVCPYCGASSPRRCDIDGIEEHECCPWDESGEYDRAVELAEDMEGDE